jgi:hypothetical protein
MSEQTKIDDGGSAFPQSETANGNTVGDEFAQGGMTLRDYFAAQALMGILSRGMIADETNVDRVRVAYDYADLMLAARNSKSE